MTTAVGVDAKVLLPARLFVTLWPDTCFDPRRTESKNPPFHAYGLLPGPAGYRFADLRAVAREGVRGEGVYSQYAIGLVLSGVFEYGSEGRVSTAVPGALLFANKDETFSWRHLCSDDNRRLVVFFAAELLEAVAEDWSLDTARFAAVSAPPSSLTQTVSALLLKVGRQHDASDEAAAAIARLALHGGRPCARPAKIPAADERRMIDVVRHINAHFAAPCTLDVLAAIAGVSRFRLARHFRAVTGETTNQYVANRRLSAAAARLVATNKPVADIAYEVGFNDLSYFYVRFRSAFGCAPGAWRHRQGRQAVVRGSSVTPAGAVEASRCGSRRAQSAAQTGTGE